MPGPTSDVSARALLVAAALVAILTATVAVWEAATLLPLLRQLVHEHGAALPPPPALRSPATLNAASPPPLPPPIGTTAASLRAMPNAATGAANPRTQLQWAVDAEGNTQQDFQDTRTLELLRNRVDALLRSVRVLGAATWFPRTCAQVLRANASAADGGYVVQPDPEAPPVVAFCDMNRHGGGWTRLIVAAPDRVAAFASWRDWPATVNGAHPASGISNGNNKSPDRGGAGGGSGQRLATGMYGGSLAVFSEVREESACFWNTTAAGGSGDSVGAVQCAQVVFGRADPVAGFTPADVRPWYGHSHAARHGLTFAAVPPCSTTPGGPADIPGCTRRAVDALSRPRGDAAVGWGVDLAPGARHCWFSRSRDCPDCPTGAFLVPNKPGQLLWSATSFR